MADLTVLFYTANVISSHFMESVKRITLNSIENLPLISVSQKPMPDFGYNICVGDIGQKYLNIYRQQLVGAREVKTEFVALVEDDILFPPSHFTCYRPSGMVAGYDINRWNLYTWKGDFFHKDHRPRMTTGAIMPTVLLVDALEERFAKYPDDSAVNLGIWGEIGRYEAQLGVTVRKTEQFFAPDPFIQTYHKDSIGYQYQGTNKRVGQIRAESIPYWGSVKEIMTLYASAN